MAGSNGHEEGTAEGTNPELTVKEQDSRDIFDFFGLPRELRNEIYSMLTHSKTFCRPQKGQGDSIGIEASIKTAPIPKLFLLCQQFRTEYQETFKYGMTIVLQDMLSSLTAPAITAWPHDISRTQIHLLCGCLGKQCTTTTCNIEADLRAHFEWMDQMLPKLKALRELEIKIYPCHGRRSNHDSIDTTTAAIAKLVGLPMIAPVEIYPLLVINEDEPSFSANAIKAYEMNWAPEAVWTKKDGWHQE